MAFSPQAVANEFLKLAWEEDAQVGPMKVQKLVYFAHGWHLAIEGPLLINEQVHAWKYGPVVRSLYHSFSNFGSRPITEQATRIKQFTKAGSPNWTRFTPCIRSEYEDAKALIRSTWNTYKDYSAAQLSTLTHEKGTPWEQVTSQCLKEYGMVPKWTDIPVPVIRDYFKSKFGELEAV